MTDDVKAAMEVLRRRVVATTSRRDNTIGVIVVGPPCDCRSCSACEARTILAYIDGEPARIAAAREEQRELCAREVEDGETCRCDFLDSDAQCGHCIGKTCADSIRATPLDAMPLADRIAELERRMAVVLHAGPSTTLAVSVFDRAEKAKARVQELERRIEGLLMGGVTVEARDEWRERAQRAQAERNESTKVLRRLTEWLSRWRRTVRITDSADGAAQAWDELERLHNEGCAVLAKYNPEGE